MKLDTTVGADAHVDGLAVEAGRDVGAVERRHGDDLERAALGVVVVGEHGHGDLAAGAHLDDVGAGDRRLVDDDGVGDGDDDDGRHRVGAAVGDLVAERRAGRRARGDA